MIIMRILSSIQRTITFEIYEDLCSSMKRGADLEEAKDDKHQIPCFRISILIPRPQNKKIKHEISSDCVASRLSEAGVKFMPGAQIGD